MAITNDKTPAITEPNDPKDPASSARATESATRSERGSTNLKVYEWAAKWGYKPRQVIVAARRLNLRVQNRLTRLPTVDAQRVLAEIRNPQKEPKPS